MTGRLIPPCGYQGGKRRHADTIANHLLSFGASRFYDLGAGSGAVTLALVSRGVPPSSITAVDAGPWGWVWEAVGRGTFDLAMLRVLMTEAVAMDPRCVKIWLETKVASMSPSPEVFLMLQAGSFGSSPVWLDGTRWTRGDCCRRYCARGYWMPGPDSPETKPRGTIFAPDAILHAMEHIMARCRGLDGRCLRVEDLAIDPGAVVYIDPPYDGSAGYGHSMDWRRIVTRHRPVVVSEGKALDDADASVALTPRKEGALQGRSRGRSDEWLNTWAVLAGGADQPHPSGSRTAVPDASRQPGAR